MAIAATPSKRPAPAQAGVITILFISLAATLFLLWLIYLHPASDQSGVRMAFLPGLDALLNGLSATSLLIGYLFIRARRITAHWRSMTAAFVFSTLFLVGYILHHALHGDVRYPLNAAFRTPYLWLLASHIILAVIALPMILTTFFFSLTKRFQMHKKIARWTFPLWLYVSITGVITYVMLRLAMSRG